MGRFRIYPRPVPPTPYDEDMRELLGSLFDRGVNVWGCTGEQVAQAFVASGLAAEFEILNPVYVAGKSSFDLLMIMAPQLPCEIPASNEVRLVPTPDYWVGWVLGAFQVETGYSYRTIFESVSYDELRGMYWPLHEAPESKFIESLGGLLEERKGATRLRRLREAMGMSQSQLARAAGIGVRSLQMYEQRNKDINNAKAITLYQLARVLRCPMESLLER